MAKSAIYGRRVHIAGSAFCTDKSPNKELTRARAMVELLVKALLKEGATFVIPIDAEKLRSDGLPVCFDWLVLTTVMDNLHLRPDPQAESLIVAVKHYKNEDQIPEQYIQLWDHLRGSPLLHIVSVARWNMNSKRMEAQSKHGDVLITIGGGEGVLFLANLYHDAAKPVIPLNFKLEDPAFGSQKLYEYGLPENQAKRLFQVTGKLTSHHWMNRIDISERMAPESITENVLALLQALVPLNAFIVRLLNPEHPDFAAVEEYFLTIVKPILEDELGFNMVVIDGEQAFENAFVDKEIFEKLHRSHFVIADITGDRPNCFLELGYAFGRSLPTIVMAKEGTRHPFDITTYSGHHWKESGTVEERKTAFRRHWDAIQKRPPIVESEPFIQ